MPRSYEQISRMEREYIALSKGLGMTPAEIARDLCRDRSTIIRELRRNADRLGRYYSRCADRKARQRRHKARKPCKMRSRAVQRSVERMLKKGWSPEQISGRRRLKRFGSLSRMTIYRYVRAQREKLGKYLRQQKRRKGKKRERIHDRTMIDDRPAIVDRRERVGDWELDNMNGPQGTGSSLATMVDRKSYYLVARLLAKRDSKHMNEQVVDGLEELPRHTMTVDNGMEFGSFKKLEEATGSKVYFAHEKCPWERGRNEHTNGLLRQYFPKGTDFSQVDPADVRRVQNLLNNRPRKSLGYRTPKEVMHQETVALVK